MVSTEYFDQSASANNQSFVGQIVLRPNNSMSWRATRYFLASLMFISFTMALVFTWHGYWLILFFTALEMGVLSACLYYLLRRNQIQEVLLFGATQVVLEVGRQEPEIRHEWQRFFTKIFVERPKHPWYPSKVAVRYKNEEREIGKFLSFADKQELIAQLRQMIVVADSCQQGAV